MLSGHQVGEWTVLSAGVVVIRDIGPRAVAGGVTTDYVSCVRQWALQGTRVHHRCPVHLVMRLISTVIGPADPRWRSVLERTAHDYCDLPKYVTLRGRR